jgi:cytidylate kinase
MTSIETIIDRQLRRWEIERQKKLEITAGGKKTEQKPVITVSRQRGSRGSYLAERLAENLAYQLLHREIIDEICNSSGYRRQVIESLDDKTRSNIELWFDGMVKGQYVDASNYFRHLLKVIMSISAHSGVVIVGRGANFIMPSNTGFHLRVIADINTRIDNLVKFQNLSRKDAETAVKVADKERSEFIRSSFRRDINDPGAYDLIINTTAIGIEDALELVKIGIKSKTNTLNLQK